MKFRQILAVSFNICLAFAFKMKQYQKMDITSYDILRISNDPNSIIQCTNICQKEINCEGIIFAGTEIGMQTFEKCEN